MAALFSGPPKPKKVEPVKTQDAEAAKAAFNRERLRAGGSYKGTIVGSGLQPGLKTALGQ